MSKATLMNIKEMILNAFGDPVADPEENKVDFKLIHAILIILANRIGILQRTVNLNNEHSISDISSSLSIVEVKIFTHEQKKKRKQGEASVPIGTSGGISKYVGTKEKSTEISGKRKAETEPKLKRKNAKESLGTVGPGGTKGKNGVINSEEGEQGGIRLEGREVGTDGKVEGVSEGVGSRKEKSSKMDGGRTIRGNKVGEAGVQKEKSDLNTKSKFKESSHSRKSVHGDSTISILEKPNTRISFSSTTVSSKQAPTPKSAKSILDKQRCKTSEPQSSGSYNKLSEKSRSHTPGTALYGRVSTIAGKTDSKKTKSYKEDEEKDFSVERKQESSKRSSINTTPQSIVSLDQFKNLVTEVNSLEDRFGPDDIHGHDDNLDLLRDLRTNASLSEPIGALQLSARLGILEGAITQMNGILTELLRSTLESKAKNPYNDTPISVYRIELKGNKGYRPVDSDTMSSDTVTISKPTSELPDSTPSTQSKVKGYWVTHPLLRSAIQELHDGIISLPHMKTMLPHIINRIMSALETIYMIGKQLQVLNINNKMQDLEKQVAQFCANLTSFDLDLSTAMTGYQDQLLQMKEDLESKLDSMNEVVGNQANKSAIEELNTHFNSLQIECDKTKSFQTVQHNIQNEFQMDLTTLQGEIQRLGETKSNRDEVTNALENKVGLEVFNGMVDVQQYAAGRGDIEKRIKLAYDKFNNMEINWQTILNELHKELNERTDIEQVAAFSKEVNSHIDNFKKKVDRIESFLGPLPRDESLRKVERDEYCLSCSNSVPKSYGDPMLPTELKYKGIDIGISSQIKEYGVHKDEKLCYPGLSAPHVCDPRVYISRNCARYCTNTNAATAMSSTPSSSSIVIDVQPLFRGRGDCSPNVPCDDKKPCEQCWGELH